MWGVRLSALGAAVQASVRTAQAISKSLPERRDPGLRPEDDLLFPLWPVSPGARVPLPDAEEQHSIEQGAAKQGAPEGATVSSKLKKSKELPPVGPAPTSSRASVQQVLYWAEHQIVPRGITREVSGGMPAGIELHDVAALGLGLLPGDRLVTVDGLSVLERSQVIGAVLGARSRRAQTMTAGLVRMTKSGPVPFTVVVEQPYPEDVPEVPPPSDSAP